MGEFKQEDDALTRHKRIKLFWLFLTESASAMNTCIDGPTIPDIRERLDITMEQFARSYVTFAIGTMLGSIISGVICDKWPRYIHAIMSAAVIGLGVTLILKPWAPSLFALALITGINGISGGVFNISRVALHFALFGAENGPMYIRHLGFAVMCPLVPLVVRNFLSDPIDQFLTAGNGTNSTLDHPALYPWWQYGDASRIEIPYGIFGAAILALAPVFAYYQCNPPPPSYVPHHKEKNSWKEIFSPGSCAGGSTCFGLSMTTTIILYHTLLLVTDIPKGHLEFSYVIDPKSPLNMTKDTASYLSTAAALAHLISRLTCVILMYWATWLKIQTLLTVCVIGLVSSLGVYVFLGLKSVPWLWVGSMSFELFKQPLWPGGLLWAENHIKVYSVIVALNEAAQGLAGMASVWTYGKTFDLNPALPFKISFAMACLFAVNFTLMRFTAIKFSPGNGEHRKEHSLNIELNDAKQSLLSDDEEEEIFELPGHSVRIRNVDL